MCSDNRLVGVEYVMDVLDISKAAAYREIRALNRELEQQGIKTLPGKVNLAFLRRKFFRLPSDKDDL